MHDDIRKFSLEGTLGDGNLVKSKERLVSHIETLMRDYNYVPSLDLEPQFTVDYVPDRECFNFTLSVYGVKIDKESAWTTGGVTNGKKIPRYTHQPK